jgi:hypothetical protein
VGVPIDQASYPAVATDALARLVRDAPALGELEPNAQIELRRSALRVMGYLARQSSSSVRPQPPRRRATLEEIELGSFVTALVRGTFEAIANASIRQMEAYVELLKSVASTVDQFTQAADARHFPRRQQWLAREVLTGIYRISRQTAVAAARNGTAGPART